MPSSNASRLSKRTFLASSVSSTSAVSSMVSTSSVIKDTIRSEGALESDICRSTGFGYSSGEKFNYRWTRVAVVSANNDNFQQLCVIFSSLEGLL